ncbi:MAG: helix-turn-helix domain containing protein [Actinomycetota bacterium]|nr:helix-turn-helix domain containing protein [Actinomycetota bacterium]
MNPMSSGNVTEVDAPGEGTAGCRSMRADARRNYERLVGAAREVFAEQGGGAAMEAIAKHAGVGVGTLYRHFPKRIDLVEAVYRTDVDELVTAAKRVVAELEPLEALHAWMDAFLAYSRSKRTLLQELREAFDKNPDLRVSLRERIEEAASLVITHAQQAGVVRSDVSGPDLMQLIGPMCTSATLSEGQGERLMAMVLDGLRPSAANA